MASALCVEGNLSRNTKYYDREQQGHDGKDGQIHKGCQKKWSPKAEIKDH